MSRSRRLLMTGIISFLALGVSAAWMKYSLSAERFSVNEQRRNLEARVEELSLGDTPADEALESVKTAHSIQMDNLRILEDLLIKPEPRYLSEGRNDPANHFKQLLVDLRERARNASGVTFQGAAPLGFVSDMQKDEEVRLGLLRLAAAERLMSALSKAAQTGRVHVIGIEHLPPKEVIRLENLYEEPAALPVKVSFAADEREVAGLLQAFSSSGTSARLESISLEATTSYEGLTAELIASYIFLGASDVLPEKEESGLPAGRRRW